MLSPFHPFLPHPHRFTIYLSCALLTTMPVSIGDGISTVFVSHIWPFSLIYKRPFRLGWISHLLFYYSRHPFCFLYPLPVSSSSIQYIFIPLYGSPLLCPLSPSLLPKLPFFFLCLVCALSSPLSIPIWLSVPLSPSLFSFLISSLPLPVPSLPLPSLPFSAPLYSEEGGKEC